MTAVLLAAVLVVAAAGVALLIRRHQPDAPTQPLRTVPVQLDRSDFAETGAAWLVAVFTSNTCETCDAALAQAEVLAAKDVSIVEVAWEVEPDLQIRYEIESVPLGVIADADGVVRASVIGPPKPGAFAAALKTAKLRRL